MYHTVFCAQQRELHSALMLRRCYASGERPVQSDQGDNGFLYAVIQSFGKIYPSVELTMRETSRAFFAEILRLTFPFRYANEFCGCCTSLTYGAVIHSVRYSVVKWGSARFDNSVAYDVPPELRRKVIATIRSLAMYVEGNPLGRKCV